MYLPTHFFDCNPTVAEKYNNRKIQYTEQMYAICKPHKISFPERNIPFAITISELCIDLPDHKSPEWLRSDARTNT